MKLTAQAYMWSRGDAEAAHALECLFRRDGQLTAEEAEMLRSSSPQVLRAARTLAERRMPRTLGIPSAIQTPRRLPLADAIVVLSSLEVWCTASIEDAPTLAGEYLAVLRALYPGDVEAWANASTEPAEVRLIGVSAMIPPELDAARRRADEFQRHGEGNTILARGLTRAVEAHGIARAA